MFVNCWESKLTIDCSSLIFICAWNMKGRSTPSAQIIDNFWLFGDDDDEEFWRGLLNELSRNDEWRNVRIDNFSRNCSIRFKIFFEGCLAERWTTSSSRTDFNNKAVAFWFDSCFW